MNTSIIEVCAHQQRVGFRDEARGIFVRLFRDLRRGKFDGDKLAKAEAESLMKSAIDFYCELSS